MLKKTNYQEYQNKRAKWLLADIVCKLLLFINSYFIFHYKLRNAIYRITGINLDKDVYVAREVLLDDNFPELITIKSGAVLSYRVIVVCHDVAYKDNKYVAPVLIEEKAVIGAGSIILPGVIVGKYSIVAAGSVVTSDVPAYSLVAGVPAKFKKRLQFDE